MPCMISAMRCSFSRMLSASCAGGRWVMSSLARGFLRSRLQPAASSSAAGTFQAWSVSFRLFHQATTGANSSNWMGAVLV